MPAFLWRIATFCTDYVLVIYIQWVLINGFESLFPSQAGLVCSLCSHFLFSKVSGLFSVLFFNGLEYNAHWQKIARKIESRTRDTISYILHVLRKLCFHDLGPDPWSNMENHFRTCWVSRRGPLAVEVSRTERRMETHLDDAKSVGFWKKYRIITH